MGASPKITESQVLMSFPDAMSEVIKGSKVTRVEWKDITEYGVLADGWLSIHTKGEFHVWKVNDTDLESKDWVVC